MANRSPLWGNFIYYADHDLLSFGILTHSGLMVPAMYHGTQAIEKYFKALILSIIDPNGMVNAISNSPWLKTHDLVELALFCGGNYPYYLQSDIIDHLHRFTEFDQVARYPWVNQKRGNGFSSSDIPIFEDIVFHLRNDLPIKNDDYPLGIAIRRCYHHKTSKVSVNNIPQIAVTALRRVLRNIDGLVRH